MANKGKVTLKDSIDKEVFDIGPKYAKSLEPALKKNKEWLRSFEAIKKSALGYAKIEKQFKVAKGRKEFLAVKKQEIQLSEQATIALKQQQATEKALITTKEKIKIATEGTNRALQKERVELQQTNKTIRQAAILSSDLAGAYQKLNLKRTQAKTTLQNLIASEKASTAEIKKAQKEFHKLDARVKKADLAVRDFGKNVGNYPQKMSRGIGALRNLAGAFGMVGGAMLAVGIARNAFKRIREFNKELHNMKGIAGDNIKNLKGLTDKIKAVAGESIKTSNEVAKLATSLFALGKTQDEVESLLEPVNNLGIALNTTGEEAGELLVQTLNAFGKGADSGQEFADTIAKIRTSTALDFERIKNSMGYLAPTAKTLGLTLADTGAVIGVLNDNGIKAERAGRLMSSSFLKLAEKGLTLEDALDQLNEVQASTNDELVIAAKASDLFGIQSAGLGIILADNRDKTKEYAESFNDVGGSLKKLTDEQLKSLDAQIQLLDSSWEAFIFSIEQGDGAISKTFSALVGYLKDSLQHLTNINTGLDKVADNKIKEKFKQKAKDYIKNIEDEVAATKGSEEEKNALLKKSFEKSLDWSKKKIEQINRKKEAIKEEIRLKAKADLPKDIVDYEKTLERIIEKRIKNNELLRGGNQVYVKANKLMELSTEKLKQLTVKETEAVENANKLAGATTNLTDAEKKLNAERRKALAEANHGLKIAQLQEEIDKYKEVVEDEGNLYSLRYRALISLNEAKKQLIEEQYKYDVENIDKTIKDEEIAKAKKKVLEINYNSDINKIKGENTQLAEKLLKDNFEAVKRNLDEKKKAQNEALAVEIESLQGQLHRKEISVEQYEEKVLELKKKKAREGLEAVVSTLETEINTRLLAGEDVVSLQDQLSATRRELSNLETDAIIEDHEKQKQSEEELAAAKAKIIADSSAGLAEALDIDAGNLDRLITGVVDGFGEGFEGVLGGIQATAAVVSDVLSSIYDANIENLQGQLDANEEYYDRQYELAGDDQRKKDLLKKDEQRKADILKKKIAKEKTKAAKAEKAAALVQAGINTALAITSALTMAPPAAYVMAALSGAMGIAQIAAIASKPIPKYAKGTDYHPGGHALVGEERAEVISEPGKAPYIVDGPQVLDLAEGTKVTPSLGEYEKLIRASIMASLDIDNQKAKDYQKETAVFDQNLLLIALEKNTQAIQAQKLSVNMKAPKIDLEYLAYRNEQLDS